MYRLNVQVTVYGRQTVPDRGVVRSCDPLQNFGAPISLKRLNLVVKFCTRVGYINSSNRMTYHQQKGRGYGHVTVLKFCRLSWCSASRGFVSDSWAILVLSCSKLRAVPFRVGLAALCVDCIFKLLMGRLCSAFSYMHDAMAMLACVLAVIVCLCRSVCLTHAGIISKQLNAGSRKQRHVIDQVIWFSDGNM